LLNAPKETPSQDLLYPAAPDNTTFYAKSKRGQPQHSTPSSVSPQGFTPDNRQSPAPKNLSQPPHFIVDISLSTLRVISPVGAYWKGIEKRIETAPALEHFQLRPAPEAQRFFSPALSVGLAEPTIHAESHREGAHLP
jgi:hypothetical protein